MTPPGKPSLFDYRAAKVLEESAPLAARMRPRSLREYIGQDHIMAPGRLLRRAIEADQLTSLIFYGPPGTGKTTLAQVIAHHTRAHFTAINAVLAGVKDIREAISGAKARLGQSGLQTVLFVDEVHRFNKAQQDALLPWVERGTVILIGATTENPYFEVNKALVSRSRVFQLKPLGPPELRRILAGALRDEERGYGDRAVAITEDAREHLVNIANGDARSLLGALELAVETTPADDQGIIRIDLHVAEESIQRRAVLYDKEGDAHFDVISAFIKSLRGSDPDAALYWLARMVYAGEEPRFILRRLIIFASEDVGLAAPEAVSIVAGCAQAFDRVGMPEGRYPLAQATLYLATAPKSNSVMGFFDALNAVEQEREGQVPVHLKDGSRDGAGFGHGKGYLYPHAYRDHWVAQQYLPGGLQGRLFYQPSHQGHEANIHAQVHRRRDAQLAAMVEREAQGAAPIEILTTGPDDADFERWLQRTVGDAGQQLDRLRSRIFDAARLQRHHVVLDLKAGTGLLTWEAARLAPEGGVYARCDTEDAAQALAQRADTLPSLRRPIVFQGPVDQPDAWGLDPTLRFDAILGRMALLQHPDKAQALLTIAERLTDNGRLVLLESLPMETQRLHALIPAHAIDDKLRQRWEAAEASIYAPDEHNPLLNWKPKDLVNAVLATGLQAQSEVLQQNTRRHITLRQLDRWFPARPKAQAHPATSSSRPSYAEHLASQLEDDEVQTIEQAMRRHLTDETVTWHSASILIVACA